MTTPNPHPEVLKRLKRAHGHLKSVLTMLEEGKACLDIAQQLHAVTKAIDSAKRALVHDHIEHCLESAVRDGADNAKETIQELTEITKYL